MTLLEPLPIVRPLPLRVEDFLMLDDSGAFEGYGKTELIDGGIVYMNAQHRPHGRAKMALAFELRDKLREANSDFSVLTEVTIAIPPHNAPEPDVVLTNQPEGDGPIPIASVALVIEVAHSTIVQDLTVKPRIYAGARVPEYWVVDVESQIIHQFWSPDGDAYRDKREHPLGDRIALAFLPITLDTSAID